MYRDEILLKKNTRKLKTQVHPLNPKFHLLILDVLSVFCEYKKHNNTKNLTRMKIQAKISYFPNKKK